MVPIFQKCVFCRRPFGGEAVMSDEHVFGEWVSKVVPGTGKFQLDGGCGQTRRKTKLMELKNHATCVACNTGWMSRIEQAAKPHLVHPIQGQHVRWATGSAQIAVSAWAFKTALMLDCCWEGQLFPARQYRYLYDLRVPLPETWITIAAYGVQPDAKTFRSGWAARSLIGYSTADGPGHGYRVTFSVGHLVFQIFGHPGREQLQPVRPVTFGDQEIEAFRTLWPLRVGRLDWPPPYGFDASALNEIV